MKTFTEESIRLLSCQQVNWTQLNLHSLNVVIILYDQYASTFNDRSLKARDGLFNISFVFFHKARYADIFFLTYEWLIGAIESSIQANCKKQAPH